MIVKIIFCFLFGSFFLATAQEITFQGKVKDINTHQELSDVNIYIQDLPIGATTDEAGKFELTIQRPKPEMIIIFNHVAYDTFQISLQDAFEKEEFFLKPNLLQTNRIIVEAKKAKSELAKDLPQSLTILSSVEFAGKGYIDAGDLLRIDQSIQVEEDLSGKKIISMRGGNPEDVVVAYNGIKMNNNYDNVFDLSLLNLEDVEQIEIIKGSNTALFGSDAFSGVVNIIPKTKPNYTARFLQKFGSYDNGDWSLQLNQSFMDKLHFSFNQRRSGMKRPYADNKDYLTNKKSHYSANMVYEISKTDESVNSLNVLYMNSNLEYNNTRMTEKIEDVNQIGSIGYVGSIGPVDQLNLSLAYQNMDNNQFITAENGYFERQFLNDNYYLKLEKTFSYNQFNLLTSYQFENGKLDFLQDVTTINKASIHLNSDYGLQRHGGVAIFKTSTPTGSEFLEDASIDLSVRYDHVTNEQKEINEEKVWQETTVKFSTELSGSDKDISYGVFLSTGNNVKFPTLFHLLSLQSQTGAPPFASSTSLKPEHNKSTEIGLNILKETPHIKTINGWQLQLNYFSNLYENKFVFYYSPEVPVPFYYNVANADIKGIESNGRVFFFDNKLTLELGASRFFISEKAAFPLKSDTKYIANLFLNYKGYSLKLNWFKESEQLGWFRTFGGYFAEAKLPGYSNIDIHLSKEIDFDFVKFNLNLSGRNLLNDDTVLEGIAIRDRRFYIGLGLIY